MFNDLSGLGKNKYIPGIIKEYGIFGTEASQMQRYLIWNTPMKVMTLFLRQMIMRL